MQSMESEFTIEVAGYDEGAMVEDTLTLPEIIIDFEHSYMGDLLITIRCPSDSVVTLHQQGGFNTFLGEPVDGDDSNPIPGICWEYRFNADPDFGTWEDCANNGVTENVVPIGSFNYALIPGSYTSIDPLDNLVGCPLNGTWTLGIFDLIAQDNGFLCSWCLSLSETPQIALQDLQPKLGLTSLDSNYWAGPNISNVAPGVSIFTPQIPGPATLNYVVVDSYGCVHDTSMVLNVLDALPVQLIDGSGDASCAVVEGVGFAQDYTYEWFYSGVSYGETGPCWTPPGNGHVSVIVTDPFGCSGEAMDATVGLSAENTPLGMELQILPTVNDGEFTLEIAQATAQIGLLRVLDMTGRTAHIEQLGLLPGQVTLPVSLSVPPGPYIVEVTTDGQQAQQRIVVR